MLRNKKKLSFTHCFRSPSLQKTINSTSPLFSYLSDKRLIISSPSIRTKQTLEYFIKEFNYNDEVKLEESIYEAPYENLLEVLQKIDDRFKTIILIGHNPGLCDLTNFLCEEYFENIPTCAIVEIDFNTNSWNEISKKNSKLISFEYPKKYK